MKRIASLLVLVPALPLQAPDLQTLVQRAYLKASNPAQSDVFGFSVAVSGGTVVVGARFEDSNATGVDGDQSNNGANNSGAAYVFVRDGSTWVQQAYLKPSNTGADDEFGWSVAISGDIVVVGAPNEDSSATGVGGNQADNSATDAGAAYVFVRNGTTWSQQAYLKASNTTPGDQLGWSVAVSGETVVAGARLWDAPSILSTGAAFVFVRDGASWSEEALLSASNAELGDFFGTSVAVAGDTVVVGAPGEDSNATGINGNQTNNFFNGAGAAYVFHRSAGSWSQEAYLKASNTGQGDSFGESLALSGETLVVGAPFEDSSATGVNGDGANNTGTNSGAAYVFRRGLQGWSQEAYLKASNTQSGDGFGDAVSVSGDLIASGAPQEDSSATGVDGDQANNSAAFAGAVFVFERSGSTWSQSAYVKASNTGVSDRFGDALALSENDLAIAAAQEDSSATGVNGEEDDDSLPDSGAVYLFEAGYLPVVTFRNAGSNPVSYTASPTVIGGSFTATVDNNAAGQLVSRLVAFDAPTSFTLAGGQTLLCLDLGSGELFTGSSLAPTSSAAGVDSYGLAVPPNPSLAGFAFCSQAIQFGNPPFVLSNAQDLTVGSL